MTAEPDVRRGYVAALTGFSIWGLFPLYWKLLSAVPALEIMLHRLCWCCIFVSAWLVVKQGPRWWRPYLTDGRLMGMLLASGLLIGVNWFLFIWAVNGGHIVDVSLGYYINPLVNVLLGTVLLKERLGRAQAVAVGLAALGVAWLTWRHGQLPWISLTLAFSFASYGFLRKLARVDSVPGLAIESALLFPLAFAYLLWIAFSGDGQFGRGLLTTDLLLVFGGIVTAVPLIAFAYGARRIPYSSLGMLQYLTPSMQLALGVWVFGERFDESRLLGFVLIWTALAIYTSDALRRLSRSAAPAR